MAVLLTMDTACYSGHSGASAVSGFGSDDGIDLDADGDADGESGDAPEDPPPAQDCTESTGSGPIFARLTRREYENTVVDLLGVSAEATGQFVPDGVVQGFETNAVAPVTALHVQDYQSAAEAIAAAAAPVAVSSLACDVATLGAQACGAQFIAELGPRAFRRPLTAEESDGLAAVFASGETFDAGVRLVISAVLQSPDFLYRVERTQPEVETGRLRLDGYALASRLSYLIWNTMPDDELFELAAADMLSDADALAEQVDRMIDDPRGSRVFVDFHAQWLGIQSLPQLSKDPTLFPEVTPQVLASMQTGTAAFVDRVVRGGDARLETLLAARWGVVDASLAALYGVVLPTVPDPTLPPGFFVAELPPAERAGLLTQVGVVAAHAKPDQTAPILRGVFTRDRVLCTPLPDPPADAPPAPAVDPMVPVREQFEQHSADPACSACHNLIDEVGFAYEHYDAVGRYRTVDFGGNPIDAAGELTGTDVDGPMADAVELAERLATSQQVQDCFATQWFRYVAARPLDAADACALQSVREQFDGTGGDVRSLLKSIVEHPSFAYQES